MAMDKSNIIILHLLTLILRSPPILWREKKPIIGVIGSFCKGGNYWYSSCELSLLLFDQYIGGGLPVLKFIYLLKRAIVMNISQLTWLESFVQWSCLFCSFLVRPEITLFAAVCSSLNMLTRHQTNQRHLFCHSQSVKGTLKPPLWHRRRSRNRLHQYSLLHAKEE